MDESEYLIHKNKSKIFENVIMRGLNNFTIGDKNYYFKRENDVRIKNGRLRQKKQINTEKKSFHCKIKHAQRKNE